MSGVTKSNIPISPQVPHQWPLTQFSIPICGSEKVNEMWKLYLFCRKKVTAQHIMKLGQYNTVCPCVCCFIALSRRFCSESFVTFTTQLESRAVWAMVYSFYVILYNWPFYWTQTTLVPDSIWLNSTLTWTSTWMRYVCCTVISAKLCDKIIVNFEILTAHLLDVKLKIFTVIFEH